MGGGAAVLEATRGDRPARAAGAVRHGDRRDREHGVRRARCGRATSCARAPGITIEINNTDAEGRLVLADCLTHAREQGAERLIDLATLTGGIVAMFGAVHAGLMGNDDAWCDAVLAAGETTGERVWRLPLDPAYDELIKGRYARHRSTRPRAARRSRSPRRAAGAVRGRRAVGAPGHRRRRRRARPAVRRQGRVGLGRAAAAAAGRQNGLHGLRPLPRPRADPPHRPRLRRGRDRARGGGARPRRSASRTRSWPSSASSG